MQTIHLNNLTKKFDNKIVVDSLNLSIRKGEIFGLLGPNAAGKTTTIRMLCGLLKPTGGSATIAGAKLNGYSDELKHKIAYVAQYFGLYDELSVWENISFYAALYGYENKIELLALLERYKIIAFKDTKAGRLSGGYKRRLSLCCALCHNPEVIFLDEPTAGIDPSTRKELWDIFYELSQEGKTLFVTTHYMEEAQRCNKIAFLSKGSIVTSGTPNEVANSLNQFHIYKNRQNFNYTLIQKLRENPYVHLVNQFGDELRIIVKKEYKREQLENFMQKFMQEKLLLENTKANLEDVFIALTQESS